MQDVFIEYMVKKKQPAGWAFLKIAIIAASVLSAMAAFIFFSPLGLLLAIGALYGGYRLVLAQNIEYEYSVTNGELDVDQIVAQRKRKRLITVDCKEMEFFGRYHPEGHQRKSYDKRLFACDWPGSPDLWCCTTRLHKGGLTLVVFNANQKMLDGIRPFLPYAIAREAFQPGD